MNYRCPHSESPFLHSVTSEKLGEISKLRDLYERQKAALLKECRAEPLPHARVAILLDGLKSLLKPSNGVRRPSVIRIDQDAVDQEDEYSDSEWGDMRRFLGQSHTMLASDSST